jgi:hypothetical protein
VIKAHLYVMCPVGGCSLSGCLWSNEQEVQCLYSTPCVLYVLDPVLDSSQECCIAIEMAVRRVFGCTYATGMAFDGNQ